MSKILQFKSGNKIWCFTPQELKENGGKNPFTGEILKAQLPRGELMTKIITELVEAGYLEAENVKESGGYQFFEEKFTNISKTPWFLSGSVPYLNYMQSKLNDIYNEEVSPSTFTNNKFVSPYLVYTIRINSRGIPKEKAREILNKELLLKTRLHYKIHLQPTVEHLRETIFRLAKLFSPEKYPISRWKISIYTPHELLENFPENVPPSIVVYPLEGHAQQVLNDIKSITNEKWGSGIIPRGNKKINDLIFYAGGDWDIKKEYPELFTPDLTLYKEQERLL